MVIQLTPVNKNSPSCIQEAQTKVISQGVGFSIGLSQGEKMKLERNLEHGNFISTTIPTYIQNPCINVIQSLLKDAELFANVDALIAYAPYFKNAQCDFMATLLRVEDDSSPYALGIIRTINLITSIYITNFSDLPSREDPRLLGNWLIFGFMKA